MNLDFNEQEMMGWQWHQHQLDYTQIICILQQTDNHTSTSSQSSYKLDALPDGIHVKALNAIFSSLL